MFLPLAAPGMTSTSLGSWSDKEQYPGHGLRICSHPLLASLSPLATSDLRLAQKRAIQAKFIQIYKSFPPTPTPAVLTASSQLSSSPIRGTPHIP